MHLASSKGYVIIDLNLRLADMAGRIRAETRLRLPDAITVSSALAGGASYIVTHDREFKKANHYLEAVTSEEMIRRL